MFALPPLPPLEALVEHTETDVLRIPCGGLYHCEEIGRDMMIVARQFAKDADLEDVKADRVPAVNVTASSDGRDYVPRWHDSREDGGEDCELVYVERHNADGRFWHGWINPLSRKIEQSG